MPKLISDKFAGFYPAKRFAIRFDVLPSTFSGSALAHEAEASCRL